MVDFADTAWLQKEDFDDIGSTTAQVSDRAALEEIESLASFCLLLPPAHLSEPASFVGYGCSSSRCSGRSQLLVLFLISLVTVLVLHYFCTTS